MKNLGKFEKDEDLVTKEQLIIEDTRDTVRDPQYYYDNYPRRVLYEFQRSSDLGIEGTSWFGVLQTIVGWKNPSGGALIQFYITQDKIYRRFGQNDSNKWSTWKELNAINSEVNFFEKSTDNANDLPNGWSLVGRQVQNIPVSTWFWIESRSFGKDTLQKAYGKDSISLRYIRIKSNGIWKDWEKL